METPRTIVLVQFSGKRSGSTISSLFVARALRESGARVIYQLGVPGIFQKQATEEGFECTVVEHGNWLRSGTVYGFLRNFWRERRRASEFRRQFAELKPDLVYVNTMVSYAAAKAAHDLGIPVIWHLREMFRDAAGEMEPPPFLGKWWAARTIRRLSRRTVAPSSAVGRNVFGCNSIPTHSVVPNTIEVTVFENVPAGADARVQLNLPAEVPIVGVVGTFRPVKGHDVLVRAIPAILRAHPDAIFVFAGYILPFCDEVRKLAADLGVAGSCRFLGEVTEIATFYAATDVICIPSRSESFGRSALEAFAARRPVVGANVGGLCDILRNGENSLVFDSGDTKALTHAIVTLLRNSERDRQLMIQSGLRDVREKYSESAHAKGIQSVVTEILH